SKLKVSLETLIRRKRRSPFRSVAGRFQSKTWSIPRSKSKLVQTRPVQGRFSPGLVHFRLVQCFRLVQSRFGPFQSGSVSLAPVQTGSIDFHPGSVIQQVKLVWFRGPEGSAYPVQ
ncbi:unnamed protein product, partial [Ilex paraguariensis]